MLKQSTLTFISNLRDNNNKPWFEENRSLYENAKADFEVLVKNVIAKFGEIDADIALLEVKNCVFRQYRDIRFSKDKTPYKGHMGASFERGGKKSGYSGYYLHIEPGNNSMTGGGIWMPEADALKKIRQEIDYNFDEFDEIIHAKEFRKIYNELEAGEFKLSREPKGYEKNNPAIEYLKLKSIVATHTLKDEDLTKKDLTDKILYSFTTLMPLIKFLNRALD